MDTTPEYVKMCDCPEIQGQRGEYKQWLDGDFMAFRDDTPQALAEAVRVQCGSCDMEYGGWGEVPDAVWLPRQDQLQEMVGYQPKSGDSAELRSYSVTTQASVLSQFAFEEYVMSRPAWLPATMEQLWLAFVMHEKFEKAWNGKEWQ